jgi:nickel-dependent lactate racemase
LKALRKPLVDISCILSTRVEATLKIEVPYGQGSMPLVLEDKRYAEVVSPRSTAPDESSIAKSLSNPLKSQDLASFLSTRKKILVVVNDHTRPTPTAAVLKKLDLNGKDIITIIASGAHRTPSQPEIEQLLGGPHPPYGGRVIVHDSRDESQLKAMGRTSRGTELQFNKQVFDTDGIITVGSVEPHYYAGFTGGRKFLLPGLAGFRSIEMNHSLALDENAKILTLEGNPVHEDFMEALDLFDRYDDIFSIQLVLNRDHEVSYTFSGHVADSFKSAIDRAREVFVAPVDAKSDIVLAVARPPMDADLYQAHKAVENVKLALKEGGIVILVSPCTDGIGPSGFYDLLASGGNISKTIRDGYRLGYHKAAKLISLTRQARLFAVTGLTSETLNQISIIPCKDVQSAVVVAGNMRGVDSRILVVLDACLTIPVPKN